jgi:hypothetical protein
MIQLNPDNLPLTRPGVYLIRHTTSGRTYVGASRNVAARLQEHNHNRCNGPPKLHAAITEYGTEAFTAEPLFYAIAAHSILGLEETALIDEFDCIENGYNIIRPWGAYGGTTKDWLNPPSKLITLLLTEIDRVSATRELLNDFTRLQ